MVRLWRAARPRPGRIAGLAAGVVPVTGYLPDAGGFGDQAAIMLAAFEVMDQAEAELLAEMQS